MKFTCSRCAVKVGVEFERPLSVMDECVYCGRGPTSGEMATALIQRLTGPVDRQVRGPAAPEAELLTTLEAAQRLRLPSERAMYQFRRRHDVPAFKVGRGLRFRKADIDSFLQKAASPKSR